MTNYNKISDLPMEERPYEKCLKAGPESLSDAELLAVIIRTGTRGFSSLQLALQVLAFSTQHTGLLGLMHISFEELISINGIGKVKAIQILCISELSKRISMSSSKKSLKFSNPASIARYYMEDLRHKENEVVYALFLDTKSFLIKSVIISSGTVNQSLMNPREILIEALKCNAVSIVLMHNHPSGDPTPSREDINSTKRMFEAGKLIGILVIDHIIIGDNRYISLRERGIL
ncbi:MAG: DNA repair protein RadC [Eubacterium sp.]